MPGQTSPTPPPPLCKAKCNSAFIALLAGGERSFTTLCFLLALACEVVSPFHALDEFDVFQVRAEGPKPRQYWTCAVVLACLCTVPVTMFVHVASISIFCELEADVQDSVGRQMGLRLLMKFAGKPC